MQEFKLKKKEIKDLSALLTRVGAVRDVSLDGQTLKQAFPEHVYVSKEDAKKMVKALYADAAKRHKGARGFYIRRQASYEWLNIGPNESLPNAVRPGYVLVDLAGISMSHLSLTKGQVRDKLKKSVHRNKRKETK